MKHASELVLLSFVVTASMGLYEGDTPSRARLWVVRNSEIVEHDPSSWAVLNIIPVPREISIDPQKLQITRTGEMLLCPGGPAVQAGSPDKVWLWNGRKSAVLNRRLAGVSSFPARKDGLDVERNLQVSISADGRQLYWFENEFGTLKNADGADLSVSTTFRVWQTDLAGGRPAQIARFSFPLCRCGTGACQETCPEASFWFPDDGISDFFIVNHWIPGQLGPMFQATYLYRRSGGKWLPRKLAHIIEDVLDAAPGGNVLIHAVRDGACCGWDNISNDQTAVAVDGKNTVIFDEWRRYSNLNYDVSFYASNAKRSPNGLFVAMTVVATARPTDGIRLSAEGKDNPGELAAIRRSLAALPAAEVIDLTNPSKPLISLPHAALAGWLGGREILIVENGMLVAFDVGTSKRRVSKIGVPNESNVFVRPAP